MYLPTCSLITPDCAYSLIRVFTGSSLVNGGTSASTDGRMLRLFRVFAGCFEPNVHFLTLWHIFFRLTLSVLQTKTYTCANSVDPGETAHNELSHQDLRCLPLFTLIFD